MNHKIVSGVIAVFAAAVIFVIAYWLGNRQAVRNNIRAVQVPEDPVRMGQRAPAYRGPSAPAVRSNVMDFGFSAFDDLQDWDPFAEMERMQRRMHRMFNDSFARGLLDRSIFRGAGAFEPNISINRQNGSYVVKVDLPGMDKSAINLEVKGKELTVSGERKEESSQQDKGYFRQELNYGSFARTILLPDDAKTDRISSQYENGVLTITIPRDMGLKPEQGTKKIPVL